MTGASSVPSAGSRAGLGALVAAAGLLCLASLVALFLVPYPASTPDAAPSTTGLPAPVPAPPPPSEPGMGDAVPAPEKPGGAPADAATAGTSERFTEDALTRRMLERPLALWSMILLRYATAVAGLVVLILFLTKRADRRKGLLPADPVRPRAVMPFDVVGSIGVLLLWAVAAPQLLSMAVHALRGGGKTPVPAAVGLLAMCATSLPIAVWIVIRARSRRPLQGTDTVPVAVSLKLGGLAFLASAAIILVVQLGAGLLLKLLLGESPELQQLVKDAVDSPSPLDAILITVLGVCVAPFAEEAVFRGTLYPAIRSLIGVRWAAVGVSALFAVTHWNLWAGLPLFALALVLTWCYERTGSILAGVLVHAAFNAASLIPILFLR